MSNGSNSYEATMNTLRMASTEADLMCLNLTLTTSLCGAYPNAPALWSWDILRWGDPQELDDGAMISEIEKAHLTSSDEHKDTSFALTHLGSIFAVFTVAGVLFLANAPEVKDEESPENPIDRFITYQDIWGIRENENELIINYGFPRKCRSITRTEDNSYMLSCIARFLCSVKQRDGIPCLQLVRSVLTEYLDNICTDEHHRRSFLCGRDAETLYDKKLTNALNTYAAKVCRDDVVGFIDNSAFGSGKSGILFGKNGIAFTSAGEWNYLPYRGIEDTEISPEGNKITFFGSFGNRGKKRGNPCIVSSLYDVSALKKCIEEIQSTSLELGV